MMAHDRSMLGYLVSTADDGRLERPPCVDRMVPRRCCSEFMTPMLFRASFTVSHSREPPSSLSLTGCLEVDTIHRTPAAASDRRHWAKLGPTRLRRTQGSRLGLRSCFSRPRLSGCRVKPNQQADMAGWPGCLTVAPAGGRRGRASEIISNFPGAGKGATSANGGRGASEPRGSLSPSLIFPFP